jgi:hypothetical protein
MSVQVDGKKVLIKADRGLEYAQQHGNRGRWCKFGSRCSDTKCTFLHPTPAAASSAPQPERNNPSLKTAAVDQNGSAKTRGAEFKQQSMLECQSAQHPCLRVYGRCSFGAACAYVHLPYDLCIRTAEGKVCTDQRCTSAHSMEDAQAVSSAFFFSSPAGDLRLPVAVRRPPAIDVQESATTAPNCSGRERTTSAAAFHQYFAADEGPVDLQSRVSVSAGQPWNFVSASFPTPVCDFSKIFSNHVSSSSGVACTTLPDPLLPSLPKRSAGVSMAAAASAAPPRPKPPTELTSSVELNTISEAAAFSKKNAASPAVCRYKKHPCIRAYGSCKVGETCDYADLPYDLCIRLANGNECTHAMCTSMHTEKEAAFVSSVDFPRHPCLRKYGHCPYGSRCVFAEEPRSMCLNFLRKNACWQKNCKEEHNKMEAIRKSYFYDFFYDVKKNKVGRGSRKSAKNAAVRSPPPPGALLATTTRMHPCLRVFGYCKFGEKCVFAKEPINMCLDFLKQKCTIRRVLFRGTSASRSCDVLFRFSCDTSRSRWRWNKCLMNGSPVLISERFFAAGQPMYTGIISSSSTDDPNELFFDVIFPQEGSLRAEARSFFLECDRRQEYDLRSFWVLESKAFFAPYSILGGIKRNLLPAGRR